MSQPKPKSPLDNSCAVIRENTLYVYTPDAFQSIDLEEGAKWKQLEMGESVTGATCVGSTPADADAAGFWVVGGAGSESGLQKYTYSTGKWENITPQNPVTSNRQGHSSIYIPANDEILIFAGTNAGGDVPNMETFSIQASEPYGVAGYDTSAPKAVRPFLLKFSEGDAMMVGGDAANTQVYLFNPNAGWRDFGASLAEPITKDASQIQAALMEGEDGSKSIYFFDMTESPNKVTRVVIQDASGEPVLNAAPVTERSLEERQDGGKWPSYNSTLAPEETRENFGIAQAPDGMVVFTGGNDQKPIEMFNGKDNEWLDASDMLVPSFRTQQDDDDDDDDDDDNTSSSESASSTESSTESSTASSDSSSSFTAESTAESTTDSSTFISSTEASSTAEPSATDTGAAVGSSSDGNNDDDGGLSSNVILGITLGSIFAFLIILALLLFCIRRRKQKQNRAAAAQAEQDPGMMPPPDEKNPQAYASVPKPPSPTSPGHFRGHYPQNSQDSYSSMAILMGRMNQQKGLQRKGSNDTGRSSMLSHHKQFKSTISKPIPQEDTRPILQDESPREVAFDPAVVSPRPRNGPPPDPEDATRRSSGWNRYWSGGSSLQILGFGGAKRNTNVSEQSSHYSQNTQPNPRATQDSATVPPLNFEGRRMNRVNSGSPIVKGQAPKLPFGEGMAGKIERPNSRASSGYSSGIPESVNEAWDPTTASKAWGTDRAPSSVYNSGFNFGSQVPSSSERHPPPGVSTQPQLAMAAQSSDMSWLNLGDQSRKNQSQF